MKDIAKRIRADFFSYVNKLQNDGFIYSDYRDSEERQLLKELDTIKNRLGPLWDKSKLEPVHISGLFNILNLRRLVSANSRIGHILLYQDCLYQVPQKYTLHEASLLILDLVDKDRRFFEKLKSRYSFEENEKFNYLRPRIPEKVRIEVWRRDQGKCAKCDSRERLEYDHIVPISRGGSNTARNIELLCESCNRIKSNKIQ